MPKTSFQRITLREIEKRYHKARYDCIVKTLLESDSVSDGNSVSDGDSDSDSHSWDLPPPLEKS